MLAAKVQSRKNLQKEQPRIVAKVDEWMALCDQLEAQLTATQADSRRLLEGVLHQALEEQHDPIPVA